MGRAISACRQADRRIDGQDGSTILLAVRELCSFVSRTTGRWLG